ncbi:MAG: hypothetical protein HY038_13260 [Nitrospirae bacterium]|nr:hypothetical protein [Nitrospirota bacterium]
MGFLSKLIDMPSFDGATNALLVELTLPTLTESQRAQLKVQVIEVFRTSSAPQTPTEVSLDDLNQAPRVAQLNVLALAMKELGYQPPLKKEALHKVRNPFDPNLADESALRAVARRLKWKHGVEIWIGSESISFDSW